MSCYCLGIVYVTDDVCSVIATSRLPVGLQGGTVGFDGLSVPEFMQKYCVGVVECCFIQVVVGRDSSVGTATHYGLDGPEIESRWWRDFLHPSRPALGPTQPPFTCTGSFPGIKRPGRGAYHPLPHNADVKESVALYLQSPCRSS